MKIKKKHHPFIIAGTVLAGVGLVAYLYEKHKTPAAPAVVPNTTVAPGGSTSTIPSPNGTNLVANPVNGG